MEYSVIFKNESANSGDVCIYQEDPDLDIDIASLAWLTKSIHPMTTVKFTWSTDYIFIWIKTDKLHSKTIIQSSEIMNTDLNKNNMVELSYEDNAYMFKNLQTNLDKADELYIVENESIPLNDAFVGIGMSGVGTFVKQAQPNRNLSFKPNPQYWITFGRYSQGEVLDTNRINNKVLLGFKPNLYSLTVTLKEDNQWEIIPRI
ncbi:protein rhiA [Clostridium sporogenes]|uniref:protein rhiA n=1 Tax=Clostridium sporogenes TaxID=1509 RepID=UPI00223896C4|nr:protein rhiA [Clostridium sporogenes]MCW6088596.1 protein rhiA [Clostridium sporogenes]MCW6088647.1 protein rhiA [Clostridium sporogenes]